MTAQSKYRRVMLKMSGASLQGEQGYGIDQATVNYVASQIKRVRELTGMGLKAAKDFVDSL